MAAQPDAAIDQLPILTAAQEAEWFEKDNGPTTTYPNLCEHEWIERQAKETPDAIAVVCGEERLSFRELSAQSNRLAHRLRSQGVGPNSLVALCLDRSINLVVAPLAVWKAGGAYIPLDPEYPGHRIAFMLEDSAAAVLVTESRLLKTLPPNLPSLICLDRDRQIFGAREHPTPTSSTTPQSLAYVIYTSGSTGKPKGGDHTALVGQFPVVDAAPARDSLIGSTAGCDYFLLRHRRARVVSATGQWRTGDNCTTLRHLRWHRPRPPAE